MSAKDVNVRSTPSATSPAVATLAPGAVFSGTLEPGGEWVKHSLVRATSARAGPPLCYAPRALLALVPMMPELALFVRVLQGYTLLAAQGTILVQPAKSADSLG